MRLVSVIIPTKNSAKTLKKCLKSIIEQSYPNIEIIVVDNYSKDDTIRISRQFTKKVYISGDERSAQRNTGAKKSTGYYLFFVDSDMYLSRDVVRECVSKMSEETLGIYIPEEILGNTFWTEVRNFERGFYNSTCIDAVRFVSKEIFNKIGGFDTSLRVAEDWDFDRRIRSLGQTSEIFTNVFHDESNFKISKYVGKKKSYFKDLKLYQQKWNNHPELSKQLGFFYRMMLVFVERGKWKRLIRHPVLSVAMIFLRALVAFEYCFFKLSHSKYNAKKQL